MVKSFLTKVKERFARRSVPTVLQMEALECGAASLSMILAYYGRWVSLEELRLKCDVTRDGSNAANILKAAQHYGLEPSAYRVEPEELDEVVLPAIIHWNFVHYVVLERITDEAVYLVDPASGPKKITHEEFSGSFTGIVLEFTLTDEFEKGGIKPNIIPNLIKRLKGSWLSLGFIAVASFGLVLPGIAIPGFSKIFIDQVLIHKTGGIIKTLLIGIAITAFLQMMFTFLQQLYLVRLQQKLSLKESAKFTWYTMRLPMNFFTQRFAGDISERISSNDNVAQLLSGQLGTNASNLISLIFYLIVMFLYSVPLTLICVVLSLVNVAVMFWVARIRIDNSRKLIKASSKLSGGLMSNLNMMETFKAMGGEGDFFQSLSGLQAKYINAQSQSETINAVVNVVPTFLNALTVMAILGVGGLQIMQGSLTVGGLVAFQALMGSFNAPLSGLLGVGGAIQQISGDLQRLDDVFNYPQSPRYTVNREKAKTNKKPRLDGAVELKNITFGYSQYGEPLLKDFSLNVKPGGRVALVGRSGSGKSTLAKLIANHYQPKEGVIKFDGININEIPPEVLSISFATVDQKITLFQGTVKDNLTMWDESVPEKDIIEAAKDAEIHNVITDRKDGYLSELDEGGYNFSGGQRQRLEIARALVNKPSILVLDEATASLDASTEKKIDDNLRRRGCTCIIIAHRLSTIRDADEIIVLDAGNVVQRGTHDELIKDKNGTYALMIKEGA